MGKKFILKKIMSFIIVICISISVIFSFSGCSMLKRKYSRDLIAAIEANDTEKLQALVDKGGDLDVLPYHKLLADGLVNIPPLIMATIKSNFEAVKILVEAGADVNIKAPFGYYPPLLESICSWCDVGNFDIAYYLIDNGADIHQKDRTTGRTAIHLCAAVGDENKQAEHLEFFEYLLKKGASFNESPEGHIAFGACYNDYNLYMLKYLFENYEIDVNMRIKYNQETMLMKTVQNGGAIKICEYLLSQGADKSLLNNEGQTVYDIALIQLNMAIERNYLDRIESLNNIINLLKD